jgi:hypothetical protein
MKTEYFLTYETEKDKKYLDQIDDRLGWININRKKIDYGCFTGELNTLTISGETPEVIQRREKYLKRNLEEGILQVDD